MNAWNELQSIQDEKTCFQTLFIIIPSAGSEFKQFEIIHFIHRIQP